MSGPAIHVPYRSANSHRKASSPRLATYETHTVASQKQLEGSGITRKGHSHPQVRPLKIVARRKQYATIYVGQPLQLQQYNVGQILHPLEHALQIFTAASKEGWGAHLNEHTVRGTWFLPES